ncbi:GDSL-type esterase/lipase family protein [Simiaoa sunii]|jgi:lysophospholipase L1-like esterase|uniref:Acylhydrolase n=1 Tax=Simiaoa sunii TaxID=2763672 RepID=A0A7G9FXH2_9FIRM|nr:GDSL-type esterase/lipase family protein [Simiaoa sunii]QNM03254.1 acylhydrolase [Simiaoa sunii]
MLQKLRQWIRKLSFPISLLLMGVLFFTWTDNWQVYTDPLRELYNRGVQLAGGARMGHTSEPGQQDGTVSGDTVPEGTEDPTGESQTPAAGETSADTQTETMTTEEPQPIEPSEELPKEVVYHTVDDSYFDDAVFIGDSRTVGMYEYGGLEETSTFYASTGLTIYKMFDSKIVAVPGQKKKITVEEALSEKQFAKIYLMIGINEMGTGTVESFMKAYGEAVQHLQQLQPDAVIYLQAIMKVTTERSGQGDYITNEGIEARNEEIAKLADDEKIYYLDVNPLICDETGGMVASYTYDGVHLKARYIPIWLDFLKEHAVE